MNGMIVNAIVTEIENTTNENTTNTNMNITKTKTTTTTSNTNVNATTTMNENARRDVLKDVSKQGTTRGSNHGIQTSCVFLSTMNMAFKTCGIKRDTIRIHGMLELMGRRCVRVRRLLL